MSDATPQIVGYVHEGMSRFMPVEVFEAWAVQRATAAERDQWRPVTWADGQGNEPVSLARPRTNALFPHAEQAAARLAQQLDDLLVPLVAEAGEESLSHIAFGNGEDRYYVNGVLRLALGPVVSTSRGSTIALTRKVTRVK